MDIIPIKFLRLDANAVIPTKRNEDVGYDLYAIRKPEASAYIVLMPGATHLFHTGLASVLAPGTWIEFKERSSTAKYGLSLRSGVIDSGYRGEWCIRRTNCSDTPIAFSWEDGIEKSLNGDEVVFPAKTKALAQFVVHKVQPSSVYEINSAEFEACAPTERGAGGWGSSGK